MAGGPASFARGSTSPALLWYASRRLTSPDVYGAVTRSGRPFQAVRLSYLQLEAPATPGRIPVWALPSSLAATGGIDALFLFLRVLRCFSSPRSLCPPYAFRRESLPKQWGFPIRKSLDQRPFAGSPKLIAGCRVLRRLSMPRHPPYTLKSLATITDHRHTRAWRDARPVALACNAPRSVTGPSFVLRRKRCSTTPHPGTPLTGACRKRKDQTNRAVGTAQSSNG